ncbi:YczE/YyaS/YitT family protein [Paenibacillus xanthanilyticus]|uniref:YitT family protein n=1 Tax=Paenibacillus xanthanilyticus TaxID=1783531 RepID=A0ABV8JZB0_9BACL
MKGLRIRTLLIFVSGLLILTLGIALTIQSGLGASPFDALLVGLADTVGLTVGSWEVLVAILLIGCNALLARQKPEVFGLLTAFITGIGIDLWLYGLGPHLAPALLVSKLACFGLGLLLLGIGTSIYLYAKFAPNPLDRLTLLIQTLTGRSIFAARTLLYLLFLIGAMIVKGPIGIGTLLTVGLGGFILHLFMPLTQRALDRMQPRDQGSAHPR